jgi:peptidoglycan hydrolase-like protein with peptidoglycan-binding domain
VTAPGPVSTPIGNTRPLSSDEVLETQAWLKAFGFDPGPLDGLPGPQTTAAVKRYRTARQMEETDALDRSILQQVPQQVGQSGQ